MGDPRWWWSLTLAVVLIGTAGALATLPTPDVTWLLHVAGRLLDGAQLGRDVVENTPPVILWLKLPVVALARAGGWDTWIVWTATIALLALGSLAGSAGLLRRVPSLRAQAPMLTAVIAVGLFLLPRQEFGQREHVAMCLILPWLLAVGARLEGVRLGRGAWLTAAVAAGVGLSIKPHFGLVLVGVGLVVVLARGWRGLAWGELVVPVGVIVAAIGMTLVLHPSWLEYARLYGPLYQQYRRANPVMVLLAGEGAEWSWLGLLALLAFRPFRLVGWGTLAIFAAAQVGFHVAAAVQMKGWPYHMLPAGVLGLLVAAGAMATSAVPAGRLVGRVYRVAVPLGIAAAGLLGAVRTARLVAQPEWKWTEADPSLRALLAEVGRSGKRETLLVLSTNIGSGWPLAHLAGADWTLRHPSLWVLAAAYSDELRQAGVVAPRGRLAQTPAERNLVAEVDEDSKRRPPTLTLAPIPREDAPAWNVAERLDLRKEIEPLFHILQPSCRAHGWREIGGYVKWTCVYAP